VKVTASPKADGLGTAFMIVVVVAAGLTICVKLAEVLPA